MNTLRHIRRPLLPGETVPAMPSLYEQIAGINGGVPPVVPVLPDSAQDDSEEEEDEDRP